MAELQRGDVATDHPYFKYVEYAVEQNVVQGYPDSTYRPIVPVNRGQMAIYIARAVCGGEDYVPTGPAIATFQARSMKSSTELFDQAK